MEQEKKKRFDVLAIFEKIFGKFKTEKDHVSDHRRCVRCHSRYKLSAVKERFAKIAHDLTKESVIIEGMRLEPEQFCSFKCAMPTTAPQPRKWLRADRQATRQRMRRDMQVASIKDINGRFPDEPRRQRRHVARLQANDWYRQSRAKSIAAKA